MPDFPPLFEGRAVVDAPFEAAIEAARSGCDAGLLLHRVSVTSIEAALVLAPEVPFAEAAEMLLVAGNGFADALGALSRPEVALHLEWPGTVRVEGARCGGLRGAVAAADPKAIPAWLVVGMSVRLARQGDAEPGETPEETDLTAEGIEIAGDDLLGAWARHTLSWIVRWEDDGIAPVHRDWMGRAWARGGHIAAETPTGTHTGSFQGLDERGGILLKDAGGTTLVPLTEAFELR